MVTSTHEGSHPKPRTVSEPKGPQAAAVGPSRYKKAMRPREGSHMLEVTQFNGKAKAQC